ncbi:MAG: glycine-rich domain-containing protein [Longimicrobiales bacterium]
MATRAVYDLTLVDESGEPFFGSLSSGDVVSESDFQTRDPVLSHDRPYLLPPEDFTSAKVDFPRGTSTIGVVSVRLLDKRLTEGDQDSGILTSVADRVTGARAILRRYRPSAGTWVTILDGPVGSHRLAPEVVALDLNIRDGREFERDDGLFSSNFVLWGKDGARGPAIDYGEHPGIRAVFGSLARPMLEAVEPFESVDDGGIDHFKRFSDLTYLGGEIYGGFATVETEVEVNGETVTRKLDLPDLGEPIVDNSDGLPKYTQIRIRWRAKGSDDDWTVLRDMPALPTRSNRNVVDDRWGILQGPNVIPGGGEQAVSKQAIWFGSLDESDIPATGQEIEFQVLAEEVSSEHPFFWDGGSLGNLLQEIVDGEHSDTPPRERYDEAELTAFRSESPVARMILREKVKDRRKWVEENVYKVAFRAPAFNDNYRIFPASWELPNNAESIPVLDADSVEPVGEWEHGTGNAIRRVNYTYIREHLLSEEVYRTINDLDDDEPVDPWDRIEEEEVTLSEEADDAVAGAKVLDYNPITVRAMGHRGGLVYSEEWHHDPVKPLAEKAFGIVLPRFKRGAPTYVATVQATDENLQHHIGDWLLVSVDWLPEYATGKRGLRRYMQIYGISDVSTERRELYLVDGNVPDFSEDPDLVDEGGVDCLAGGTAIGGTLFPAPSGASLRYFLEDGHIVNSCSKDLTVQVVLIGGGGGGGDSNGDWVGGGAGAGGVVQIAELTIPAGESIPVTVGSGGPVGADGGDSILWRDPSTGAALDPDSDPAPSETTAVGGGRGGGSNGSPRAGGSGGGGGGFMAGGTAENQVGGGSESGQGNDGGDGQGSNGSGDEISGGGGGGGSLAAEGENGTADVAGNTTSAGAGGGETALNDWGITAGGGGDGGEYFREIDGTVQIDNPGARGGGDFGAGGGGASATGGASAGTDGFVAVIYAGAPPSLTAPEITSTAETEAQGLQICVSEDEWPVIDLPGYRVRVEYAVTGPSDPEPDEDSSDWTLAGFLDAPGCLYTGTLQNGGRLWKRVRAEARDYQPSDWGTTTSETLTETPDFLSVSLSISSSGRATLEWSANPYTGGVRIRALRHDADASAGDLDPDLPLLTDADASAGSYEIQLSISREQYITIDLEAWETFSGGSVGGDQGRRRRISRQRPALSAEAQAGALDRLVLTNDLNLVFDNDLNPITNE